MERAAGNHTYLVKKTGHERGNRSLYQLVHVRVPLAMLSLDNRMAHPRAGVLSQTRSAVIAAPQVHTGAALGRFS